MNRKAKNGPRDRVVCFCYSVTESTIIEAIRNGCTSLQDIRLQTYASTGCAGCAEEVKKLLRKYAVPGGGQGGQVEEFGGEHGNSTRRKQKAGQGEGGCSNISRPRLPALP